jgi:hypothetical protein
MYRSSQHGSLEDAEIAGAVRVIDTVHGNTAPLDLLLAMMLTADMIDAISDETDIRVVATINGEEQPECYLSQAWHMANLY